MVILPESLFHIDKSKIKEIAGSKQSISSYFGFVFSDLISFFGTVVGIANGISSFFSYLYHSLPPVVNRLADGLLVCHNFFTQTFTEPSKGVYAETGKVVSDIESNLIQGDGGSSLWEMVKYMINLDALADFLNFVVSIGWLWITLLVLVLLVCTGLLLSGCVIYVTRRALVFISLGNLNYG